MPRNTAALRKLYETAHAQGGFFTARQARDAGYEDSVHPYQVIDSIVLTPEKGQPPSRHGDDPRSGEPRLRIELRGNLAAMLAAAQQTKRSPETGDLLVPVQLVAGARNPLNMEFAWSAA